MNQFNQKSQRGPSLLDQTHRLVLSGSWMPQMKGLKGLTVSSVATIASGRPYTGVFDTANVNFSIVPGEEFNSFRGPGVRDLELSVARSFRLNERLGLKFRVEAFDLLNHANFQQNAVNNVQYTTTERCALQPDGTCTALPIWDAAVNSTFGKPFFGAEVWLTEFAVFGALQFLATQGWLKRQYLLATKPKLELGCFEGVLQGLARG